MKNYMAITWLVGVLFLGSGCGETKEQEIKRLINELGGKATTTSQKDETVKRLVKKGDDAVKPLLSAMKKHKDSSVRRYCALALAKLGVDEAEEPIRTMLFEDKSPDNRAYATDALTILKKEAAIPDLIRVLKEDKDSAPRQSAREALSRKEIASAAREQLLPFLSDKDVNIRTEARKTIVLIGIDCVPSLVNMLSTDDKTLIIEIFQTLVEIGDASVQPALKAKMEQLKQNEYVDRERAIMSKFYKQLENLYNKF